MFALTFPRHRRVNGNKVGRWCQTFRSELAPLKPAKLAKVSGILTQIPRQQLSLVSGVQTSGKVSAAVYLGRPKHKRNWRTSRSGGRAVAARLVFWKSYVNIVDHAKFEVRSFSMFFFLVLKRWMFRAYFSFLGRSGYFGVNKNIRSGDSFAGKLRASQHLSKAMHPLGERNMPEGLSLWFLPFGT